MSCIIADSGPFIVLAGVDLLHLLQAVYGHVIVTKTVIAECILKRERVDARRILKAVEDHRLIICNDRSIPPCLVEPYCSTRSRVMQFKTNKKIPHWSGI